ncbi:hypothetical protein FB451DRAFT_1405879 [Mycena latifolia]|nr:hypothetical protein FB451DRAFT_1405879 [Mycena latifolia]
MASKSLADTPHAGNPSISQARIPGQETGACLFAINRWRLHRFCLPSAAAPKQPVDDDDDDGGGRLPPTARAGPYPNVRRRCIVFRDSRNSLAKEDERRGRREAIPEAFDALPPAPGAERTTNDAHPHITSRDGAPTRRVDYAGDIGRIGRRRAFMTSFAQPIHPIRCNNHPVPATPYHRHQMHAPSGIARPNKPPGYPAVRSRLITARMGIPADGRGRTDRKAHCGDRAVFGGGAAPDGARRARPRAATTWELVGARASSRCRQVYAGDTFSTGHTDGRPTKGDCRFWTWNPEHGFQLRRSYECPPTARAMIDEPDPVPTYLGDDCPPYTPAVDVSSSPPAYAFTNTGRLQPTPRLSIWAHLKARATAVKKALFRGRRAGGETYEMNTFRG